jgi:glycosyltransferase involved in cell wall biosynthesis
MKQIETIQLTVITPITALANQLENLMTWLSRIYDESIEVYLIHDRSDTQTGPQIKELLKKLQNSQIHLIEGEFGSPGIARNQALKLAQGKWVCFWDADDLPIIESVIHLINKEFNKGGDCVVASYIEEDMKRNLRTQHSLINDFEVSVGLNPGLWRFFFTKLSIAETKFTNLRMGEDQLFLAEYLNVNRQIRIFPHYTYTYFKNREFSLTGSKTALSDIVKAAKGTLKIINKSNSDHSFLIGIMFARQIATGIKRGNLKCKMLALSTLMQGVIFSNRKTKIWIFKGISKVILNGN